MTHPYVEECAVCGRWDEEGQTELPVAYIKLSRQGQKAHRTAPVEIAQMVSSQVSSYKRLRGGVMCLEELPKTSSGKILKRLLGSNDVGRQDAKL